MIIHRIVVIIGLALSVSSCGNLPKPSDASRARSTREERLPTNQKRIHASDYRDWPFVEDVQSGIIGCDGSTSDPAVWFRTDAKGTYALNGLASKNGKVPFAYEAIVKRDEVLIRQLLAANGLKESDTSPDAKKIKSSNVWMSASAIQKDALQLCR